jgi:hypothetical protein
MKNKVKNNTSESNIPFSYNQYLLNQIENYKEKINRDLSYILNKYVELIIEYIKFITEKINIKKNKYFTFIFIRGYDTITAVFKIMLYYTKNVDLTFYHCQKAFYFYVEFIEQISTDQNSFLQLSSREASLFVYKKTIYEINLEYKKNMKDCCSEDKMILDKLDNFLYLNKNIVLCFIKYFNNLESENINLLCEYLNSCNENKNILNLTSIQFNCLHLLLDQLIDKTQNISFSLFFEIITLFVSKIISKKNIGENLKVQIMDNDLTNYLTDSKQFINWLFL